MFGSEARWSQFRCVRQSDFSLQSWTDGAVLYDEASGKLHCLTVIAGELFVCFLDQSQWSISDLARRLLRAEPESGDIDMVGNIIDHFHLLNLIERVVC
mgnify:CR=1 FL=1